MRAGVSVVLTLCLALPAGAGTGGLEVEATGSQVTVRAQRVPLNKILDRLAQQTGMKVTYESAPPSQPVTATIERLPVRDAVVRLMEGLGVAYVFRTDVSGQRVETLFISSDTTGTATRSASSGGSPQEAVEYPTEVIEDVAEYEEPQEIPQPVPGEMPTMPGGAAPDLALPNLGAGPGFPTQANPATFPGPGGSGFPVSPQYPAGISNPSLN